MHPVRARPHGWPMWREVLLGPLPLALVLAPAGLAQAQAVAAAPAQGQTQTQPPTLNGTQPKDQAPASASASGGGLDSLPISFTLGIENLRLPGGENLGLAGGTLLFGIGGDWSLGPAVYGAATGQRGGFLVGGIALQRRFVLGQGFSVAADLFAGGGGGGAAPVGSGLMLRPAVTLYKDLTPSTQLGLSWSYVSFPSGQIDSAQLGLADRKSVV